MPASLRFTDRHGGVSPPPYDSLNLAEHVGDRPDSVAANRALLAAGVLSTVWMGQVHGASVAVVGDDHVPAGAAAVTVAGVDALVTARAGTALAVLVADCAPVLLADPVAGVVGAVHVGRSGLVAGVLPAAVAALVRLGGQAERLEARVGPCIGGCCYELPAELAAEVADTVPGSGARTRWGTPSVDLRAGLRAQLGAAGVHRVAVSPVCTFESADHFSYRRDGRTGRFAGVAVLTGPA